jgi:hypothetical protein
MACDPASGCAAIHGTIVQLRGFIDPFVFTGPLRGRQAASGTSGN